MSVADVTVHRAIIASYVRGRLAAEQRWILARAFAGVLEQSTATVARQTLATLRELHTGLDDARLTPTSAPAVGPSVNTTDVEDDIYSFLLASRGSCYFIDLSAYNNVD